MNTPEHRAYLRHLERCRVCSRGGQCPEGYGLLRDADASDWRRQRLREPAGAA